MAVYRKGRVMTSQKVPADPCEAFNPNDYYSITAVCERLDVGRWTVQTAINDKSLPAVKAGKRIRIRGKELNQWITPYA